MPVRVGAPGTIGVVSTGNAVDVNWISVTVVACGSSIWNHIPACWACPDVHGLMPSACDAIAGLWLAVSFHPSASTSFGKDPSSSVVVHGFLRVFVAARTLVTSAGDTIEARLPNEFRTYEAIAAIQSSGLCPMGTITSV